MTAEAVQRQLQTTLDAGQTDTVSFPTLILQSPGNYRFRFITDWTADSNPANDTLTNWTEVALGVNQSMSGTVTEFIG